jgi:hypothetical protein
MSNIAGAFLLISLGLNGLAIWYLKDYKRLEAENGELYSANAEQFNEITDLEEEVIELRRKTTPWNKGKAGQYKLGKRTPKELPQPLSGSEVL